MKTDELNKVVENSLNPYTIVRMISLNTKEELAEIERNVPEFDISTVSDMVEIEISPVEMILFITKNDLSTMSKRLSNVGVKFITTNIVDEIFEMDNLDELLSKLNEEHNLSDEEKELVDECFPGYIPKKQKAINIINTVFESNFGVDDVLDRINVKGSGSLNEFHKNLLK